MSLSMTSVHGLYMGVIDGVISGARELFLDEGVDEQVLTELRDIWETRLKATKAIETKPDKPQPPVINKPATASIGAVPAPELPAAKMVSLQITLPSPPQPGVTTPPPPKYITIQAPASAMEGNQLKSLITGPVISSIMALPSTELATSLLQQHVNSHFEQQQQLQRQNAGVIQQRQVDGTRDTSDDDDDDEDEDEDDDDDDLDDKDEEENDEMGAEEEPLNSGDDEEDASDTFETDNVVVCQFDKITRNRNKWKFYLKDGIMNLGGKDYVFQKSNGDGEW